MKSMTVEDGRLVSIRVDVEDVDGVLSAMQALADVAYGHFARQAEQTADKCQTCGHVSKSNGWQEAQKLHGIKTRIDNIRERLKT